jgi:malate dehydrogenase (oxaloacetate-decarboxylating)
MKVAAAEAIAAIVPPKDLREDFIIPSPLDRDVAPAVAEAVARVARRDGTARNEQPTIGFAALDARRMRAER